MNLYFSNVYKIEFQMTPKSSITHPVLSVLLSIYVTYIRIRPVVKHKNYLLDITYGHLDTTHIHKLITHFFVWLDPFTVTGHKHSPPK